MSAPYYSDESVTLYHGDALAVLRDLPSSSVDALITDPPYSSGGMVRGDRTGSDTASKYSGYGGKKAEHGEFSGDNRDQRGYAYWVALWLGECRRVVKQGGTAMLFTDWRQLPSTTDALQGGGFVWRGIVPWYKPVSRPTSGRFTANCEYVVWGSNGPMPTDDLSAPCFPGFYQASPPRGREHLTQKPLEVMRQLVRIVPEGGVVLDPFAGSGTTGVAAVIESRRFIGVELVERFAEISTRRIRIAAGHAVTKGHQDALDFSEALA